MAFNRRVLYDAHDGCFARGSKATGAGSAIGDVLLHFIWAAIGVTAVWIESVRAVGLAELNTEEALEAATDGDSGFSSACTESWGVANVCRHSAARCIAMPFAYFVHAVDFPLVDENLGDRLGRGGGGQAELKYGGGGEYESEYFSHFDL